jgi:cytochrome P450
MARRALEECTIEGHVVPANATMVMSPYLTQRDPRFFPTPELFDPDRWLGQADAAAQGMTYFPFGGGSRRCIGERFALMEAMLIVATVAQRWRLRPIGDQPVQTWLRSAGTLEPKSTIWMRAERRQPASIRQTSNFLERATAGISDGQGKTCPYAAL